MIALLDVNVLIALIDPDHAAHERAHAWFARHAQSGWATCPITELGAIRIAGAASYTQPALGCAAVTRSVRHICALANHVFWPDDVSLLTSPLVDATNLLSSHRITDTYLLALALAHGGVLATFDRRLSPDAVKGGAAALHVID